MRCELLSRVCRCTLGVVMLAGAFTVSAGATTRQKTDVVTMQDGSVLYGETKEMTLGKLSLSTHYASTVKIQWAHVEFLESTYSFQVESQSGVKYFGTLEKSSTARGLVVKQVSGSIMLDMSEVVAITPIRKTFWTRIDGNLNLGFTYAKAGNVFQLTLDWTATYRSRKNALTASANVIFNQTGGETATQRQDYSLGYARLLSGRWFGAGRVAFQQNQELGVALRQLIFAGPGVHLIQTNHDFVSIAAGLDINNELGTDTDSYRQSLEALINLAYNLFQYGSPKTNVSASVSLFPSLTISDRLRTDFDASFSRDVVHNLNAALSGYYSYDSDPPAADASNNDWSIVVSVGWSY